MEQKPLITFNEYQERALATRDCPDSMYYYALGLTGEAGEVSDKIKKFWRDTVYPTAKEYNAQHPREAVSENDTHVDADMNLFSHEHKQAVIKELGDTMWYIAAIANTLGVTLEEVAWTNLMKIESRVKTGTIHGEGDNREQNNN